MFCVYEIWLVIYEKNYPDLFYYLRFSTHILQFIYFSLTTTIFSVRVGDWKIQLWGKFPQMLMEGLQINKIKKKKFEENSTITWKNL